MIRCFFIALYLSDDDRAAKTPAKTTYLRNKINLAFVINLAGGWGWR